VPRLAPGSPEAKTIDAALADWRQGDLALEEHWFVHVGDPVLALTDAAAEESTTGLQALTSEVSGLAIVTQTCDVVRACCERPYIEVAPVVPIAPEELRGIQRGRRPAYAALPAILSRYLVVDIDRVMTVEKAIASTWKRTPGYTSDDDGRAFALALARKRVRFAFPDDFTLFARKLQSRLVEKHDKQTDEGKGLRALREIRVAATPGWDAESVALMFWFIRDETLDQWEGKNWSDLLAAWLELVPNSARFASVNGQVVTLHDLSGADYVGSDPLDLDHLTSRVSS
jgi:hypothetical protein